MTPMILSGFQLAEEWSSVLPLGVMLSPLVEISHFIFLSEVRSLLGVCDIKLMVDAKCVMLSPLVEIFSLLKLGQATPNPRNHVNDYDKHLSKEYENLLGMFQ